MDTTNTTSTTTPIMPVSFYDKAFDCMKRLQPHVEQGWRLANAVLSADNPSMVSIICRVLMTLSSYCLLYTKVAGMIVWTFAYLMDHHWYLLAFTTSVALLLVSTAVLTSYEWMWRWQELLAVPAGTAQRRRTTIVVVEENVDFDMDEDSLQAWAKKLGKMLVVLIIWAVYCAVNVRLDFWIWSQYLVAHPNHNVEIQLVNWLEAGCILIGAAFTLYYLYPPFYTWHAPRTTTNYDSDSPAANEEEDMDSAMQSLLS